MAHGWSARTGLGDLVGLGSARPLPLAVLERDWVLRRGGAPLFGAALLLLGDGWSARTGLGDLVGLGSARPLPLAVLERDRVLRRGGAPLFGAALLLLGDLPERSGLLFGDFDLLGRAVALLLFVDLRLASLRRRSLSCSFLSASCLCSIYLLSAICLRFLSVLDVFLVAVCLFVLLTCFAFTRLPPFCLANISHSLSCLRATCAFELDVYRLKFCFFHA